MRGDGSSSRSPFSRLVRTKTPHGYISHQSRGTSPENMNLQVNEPTRRPGQPLCQDPWCCSAFSSSVKNRCGRERGQIIGLRGTAHEEVEWRGRFLALSVS